MSNGAAVAENQPGQIVDYGNTYIKAVQNLNVYRRGQRRAPHKPLLLLIAISRLLGGQREITYTNVVKMLEPLLRSYAPPVKSRHQPELPYWHLRRDGLWDVSGAEHLPLRQDNFPYMEGLKATSGHLDPGFAKAIESNPSLLRAVVTVLLDDHFPEKLHDSILEAVGLRLPPADRVGEEYAAKKRPRDPMFRQNVLRAYEHRCAVTGFQVALGGQFFGCEAAHVQWHAYDGPDDVANGFAVEPTVHTLFDAGAWTLTDDRRVLVSADLTGSDETVARLRGLHGTPLRKPIPGEAQVSVEYIRWHREPDLGGVFRRPGLPL